LSIKLLYCHLLPDFILYNKIILLHKNQKKMSRVINELLINGMTYANEIAIPEISLFCKNWAKLFFGWLVIAPVAICGW